MSVRRSAPRGLKPAIAKLATLYPSPKPMSDPLALIVWENIGYLIDDARRAELFEEFRERVGIDADKIMRAPGSVLLDIAKRGGMNPGTRVARLKNIASIARECGDGGLLSALKSLPLPKARTLLKKFPSVADPGADKILLFSGVSVQPALESNGLRVLVRLGFAPQQSSYTASYKAAVAALAKQGTMERDWLIEAYVVLRAHGQTLCKRSAPNCMACPLDKSCAHLPATGL
jgi:endonuclease-3